MISLLSLQLTAIRRQKVEFTLLVLVLLTATFLRFYRLSDYMTFLGDEGRDAIVVKNILLTHHFPLIGPPMSVGNMYLGPLYYYMMAISMAIFWLNPVAAAGMNALIGILTVCLIYYLAKQWFGKYPAIVASLSYAISPVTIIYSRSSWNPNPVPFFTLLCVIGIYKTHQTKNFLWLILTGISLAFAIQMHYLSLILIPFLLIAWIYELIKGKQSNLKYFFRGTITSILVFLFLMSPLLIFDIRHNFMNYHAIAEFFFKRDSTVSINIVEILSRIYTLYTQKLIGRYLTGDSMIPSIIISILTLVPAVKFGWELIGKKSFNWCYFILITWLFTGVIFILFLNQDIYDHYLNFINPIPYLLLAAFLGLLSSRSQLIACAMLITLLVILNFPKDPLLYSPNNQLYKTQQISKYLILQSENKPFNFALLAARNYDSAYQFYLDIYGHKPKVVPKEITPLLFVVCEDQICNPINNPKYEIAGFGYAKIQSEDQILGVRVFKLVSNPGGRPQ